MQFFLSILVILCNYLSSLVNLIFTLFLSFFLSFFLSLFLSHSLSLSSSFCFRTTESLYHSLAQLYLLQCVQISFALKPMCFLLTQISIHPCQSIYTFSTYISVHLFICLILVLYVSITLSSISKQFSFQFFVCSLSIYFL